MSVSLKKQDLPPAGGYAPINFKRIPPKSYFNGYAMAALYFGVTTVALGLYARNYYSKKREEIEMRSARMAILPLLLAEKDRAFLMQLKKNRDAENDLMKNVEGWKTGTLYGDRVFKSIPEDSIVMPSDGEFYAHADVDAWYKRTSIHLYS